MTVVRRGPVIADADEPISPRVLVLTPLAAEQAILVAALRQLHPLEAVADFRIPCWYVPQWSALMALGGHGKAQFATQTQYLIDQFPTVELVVCAGAAGSLHPSVSVGDVVIGTTTVEHDYRLLFACRPSPCFTGQPAALALLRSVADDIAGFKSHFGVIASGDEDVVSSERAASIHEQTGALCVAWEGSGAARAALFSGVGAIEVRAITDTADKEAPKSFEAHLPTAMHNLATLLMPFLNHWAAT
jgi:adenosylhomocysteine nucleosidase